MEVCCFYKLFSFLSGNLHIPSFNPQSFEILLRCPNMGLFHSIWSFLCHLNLGKFSTVFSTISFPSLSLILSCGTPDTHCWIWFHILSILIFSIFYIWEFTLTWFSRLVVSTLSYHLVHCLIFFFNLTVLFLVARYFFFLSCSIFSLLSGLFFYECSSLSHVFENANK